MLLDAWRLAFGTLTALPVRPPRVVDRRRAGLAMVLAPLAVLPLGLGVAVVLAVGHLLALPSLVTALLAVGLAILGNRAFHLDGLSDTVDGLAASYDRERSLAVMKGGTAGPAGVVATVLVVGLQAAALTGDGLAQYGISGDHGWFAYGPVPSGVHASWMALTQGGWHGAVLAGVALCVARGALVICCARGVRPAREDGLGRTYTQTVPVAVAVVVWIVLAAVLALVGCWAGLPLWRGALAAVLAAAVVGITVTTAVRRFGGVTGDVFGAAVELACATLLVALA